MSNLVMSGITGTDGKNPIQDTSSRFAWWAYDEIYLGFEADGKWIPKVGDRVLNRETEDVFKVIELDPVTFVPRLQAVNRTPNPEPTDATDILLADNPGSYRVYLDKSVMPFALTVEQRCWINGTMARYAKIFRGSELEGNLQVISQYFDGAGNLIGNEVPLELVRVPNGQNYATYGVKTCFTTADMPDGELVTLMIYSDTGHVVSRRRLLVENTAAYRSVNDDTKYITGITLDTPFLSESDDKMILYPMNLPVSGLNLFGVVHYNDGSKLRLPVDGTKFKISGLSAFVATIIGAEYPVVLHYTMSDGEAAFSPDATLFDTDGITASYRLRVEEARGSYTPKLYPYPVWIDEVNGYRLEWFLYTLERQLAQKVTEHVRFGDNTPSYNPILYGANQRLSVNINMKDVNASNKEWIFTQVVDITLQRPGSETGTNWTIGFIPGQNPPFGQNNQVKYQFVNQNLSYFDVTSDAATKEEWLDRMYYRTLPLTDPNSEALPPAPDYFILMVGNGEYVYSVDQWADQLIVNVPVQNLGTAYLKFIRRTVDTDLQLAIAGVPIHQV